MHAASGWEEEAGEEAWLWLLLLRDGERGVDV
jgi:hypothetical protein